MHRIYNFPVYGTQGGGLVREVNGVYIFVEKPIYYSHLDIGDTMSEGWSIAPANEQARQEVLDHEDPFADHGEFDDLNDELAEQVDPIEKEIDDSIRQDREARQLFVEEEEKNRR